MIEIDHVTKIYKSKKRTVTGVNDVSLQVEKGDIYGIVGYSGAGKSTLIRCLNLLERPTSGTITVDGTDLTSLKGEDLRQARIKTGMIFQHFYLINQKTVFENIAFALRAAKTPTDDIKHRTEELLRRVGLADKRDAYPAQLSGGQKQRVGIARALANNPTVLLCDEATSALDPTTTKSILNLLKDLNEELGLTIVLISHEMEVVKEICHKMAIMQDGEIIESGNVYDVFAAPKKQLTKEFIGNVVSFELPEETLTACTGTIIKVMFQGEIAGEGIISDTLQKYTVKGNFLHGAIEYIGGKPLGIFEEGDHIVLAMSSDAVSMDPHVATDLPSNYIADNVFESLLDFDENMEIQPRLAESYEQLDENTWEFNLQEDVTFHDGEPFNADAVVATFERMLES